MQNLYWNFKGDIRTLLEKPFESEAKLEKYIFANQELLGDISIIYRQISTGQKQGIPDMLGIDQDGRICIFELKNQTTNEDVLPQALRYAIWAETNPDSIKAIWLESKTKPEDIEIDWDNLDIRVVIVAPKFKQNVLRMAGKIGYPIDLVQITRYSLDQDEFVLVEFIEEEPQKKISTTKGITTWDWDYYESEHGKEATTQFQNVVNKIDDYVKQKGWNLPYNLNKHYTGFKLGNKVVISVAWTSRYTWKLKAKLAPDHIKEFKGSNWEYLKYDGIFKEAVFVPLDPNIADIKEIGDVFEAAYQKVLGS